MQLGIGNRAIKPDYPFGVVVERDAVGLEPNRVTIPNRPGAVAQRLSAIDPYMSCDGVPSAAMVRVHARHIRSYPFCSTNPPGRATAVILRSGIPSLSHARFSGHWCKSDANCSI